MCTYTDKSRSPGKHAAREFVGSHLDHKDGFAIVIVGWDKQTDQFQCGDIPHLIKQGYDRGRIIVCGYSGAESDTRAREWAGNSYPGVIESPHAGIAETVSWAFQMGLKLSLINVDLCSTLIKAAPVMRKVLLAVKEAAWRYRQHITVSLTTTRGHDEATQAFGYGDEGRDNYLAHHIGDLVSSPKGCIEFDAVAEAPDYSAVQQFRYQSYTLYPNGDTLSYGSPMSVRVYKPRYACKKCGLMNVHPAKHIKICGGSAPVLPQPKWNIIPAVPKIRFSMYQYECGNCGGLGHNRRTCREQKLA